MYTFYLGCKAKVSIDLWENMHEVMYLLLQDTYFDTMIVQDFPFYFNLACSVVYTSNLLLVLIFLIS